ncbi:cation-transporting P-type ATPase [Cryptosporidium sp. chipmunk genotype I]|uniref:cation-transporting P-type ATPase n=1 Tax=Cryptosporidium sp. chipmunk genotype I TaxID=1280935 RepID=UPI00351A39CE|nr:cation-transporting P-type ATPase [Cryptosporidium sp. chipmunk genotype I]
MSKYTFTEYKRLNNTIFRLDVFPFITIYIVLISILLGEIFSLSETISYKDVFDSFIYLINFIQNLNNLNTTVVPNEQVFNSLISNNTNNIGISEFDDSNMSEELQLIIDNVPIRYIVAIFITILINLLAFLMTQWNLKFKSVICFNKIKKKSHGTSSLNTKATTHIMVKSSKYPSELCPLKYSTCIEHVGKLKDFNSLTKIKSCCIVNMNGSFIIQIDANDYHKYKPELEKILFKNVNKSDNSNFLPNSSNINWIKLINYEKKTFIYDQSKETFIKANYPINLPIKSYFDQLIHKGGLNMNEIILHNNLYGINNYEIPREKFLDLFIEQIISPFFLFQIFCVLLWILDEYWQMSLFTLFMLCTLEAQMVFRRLKELDELRNMRRPSCFILVYREHTWKYINTDHLLPGDIIAISSTISSNSSKNTNLDENNNQDDATSIAPCDFVLLSGSITVNEAMLTGECTPKMKVSMIFDENEQDVKLNEKNFNIEEFKNHVIFAGTNIILTRSSIVTENKEFQSIIKKISNEYHNCYSVDNMNSYNNQINSNEKYNNNNVISSYIKYDNDKMICIGYVLRTGFNTYQGKLIRTISSSAEKISSNSFESLIFLMILIFCSLIASSYVLYNGLNDSSRNKFKLIISCIHIITSVIPPEFPITLSVAVTMAVVQLSKKKIYCTEPFRIPFAGKLRICAFDKTGTLTSDKMIPHGLFGINLYDNDETSCITFENSNNSGINDEEGGEMNNRKSISSTCSVDLPFLSDVIMGCCNGLSLNGKILVGDPMEKSIKKKSSWRIHHSSENNYHSLKDNSTFSIVRRYPFLPEEQRMTNIGILQIPSENQAQSGTSQVSSTSSPPIIFHINLSKPSPKTYGLVISKGSPEMMLQFFKKDQGFDQKLYKNVVNQCTEKGYRILALGSKYCSINEVNNRHLKREFFESDLTFCGFLALYCPIKKHSKSVIEELNKSNHQCIMITGDNILTAFHVAKNVSITNNNKDILILSKSDDEISNNVNYIWKYSNGSIFKKFDNNLNHLININNEFNIGITGIVFQSFIEDFKETKILEKLLLFTRIYARMSPKNKQTLINLYNNMGNMTLMCGDGTNDVGALKHSHVGISLLSNELSDSNNKDNNHSKVNIKKKKPSFFEIKKDIEARIRRGERLTKAQIQQEIMKELQGMDEIPKVKLGDASIASPFTYKGESPNCIIKLVRYGRSTLTTVLLMYKLMGLNSIVSAFAMSVLAHDGVKFGDFQTTVESIIMSGLFFLVLRNKPAKKLVPQKPPNSIFSPTVFLSFIIQALIHLFVIYFGWKLSYSLMPLNYSTNIDGPFEPNIINTTMYYLYTACHLACFLSNAQGYPFTTSLSENKYLIYTSVLVISFLITSILGIFPHLNMLFSLVTLQNKYYQLIMIFLVIFDIFGTFLINKLFNKLHVYFDKCKH